MSGTKSERPAEMECWRSEPAEATWTHTRTVVGAVPMSLVVASPISLGLWVAIIWGCWRLFS